MISMMVEAVALSLDISPELLYDLTIDELYDMYRWTE